MGAVGFRDREPVQNMEQQLTDILIDRHNVSEDQLRIARAVQEEKGGRLRDILIQKRMISEADLLGAIGQQYRLPVWPALPLDHLDTDYTQRVPIQFLKRFFMVPIGKHPPDLPETLSLSPGEKEAGAPNRAESDRIGTVAINDPDALQALDDLVRILGPETCQVVLSTKEEILSAINMAYEFSRDSAEQLVQDMTENGASIIGDIEATADLLDDTSDAPIIRLVNHIISQSIKARSSDIHIETYQDSLKVRHRIDGILYDLITPPKSIQSALISRIKVMAKMNIAEKRLPQDGRFDVRIGDHEIDVRVSTIPTSFGERVVLRLLNKTGSVLRLTELGLEPERLSLLEDLVTAPNGIILVTGPTGSGKTTTLYAVLSSINHPDINIITIEDPIEYQLKGISQIQVNPKIDLTFAKGLRSIVRQDPDVILVGEIRDRETADIAVQSALTGHLVFSTLHTNDSASAITRLVDIGVEPFLISSSVLAVVAQRLVRTLCKECKAAYRPDEALLKSLELPREMGGRDAFFESRGCDPCFGTGFRGRIGIFEIMVLTGELKGLILRSFDSNAIKEEALKRGMVTLRMDGIQKVLDGITTIEEILRVTQK